MNKDNFGYQSRLECVVCGTYKNNQMEPRFLYTVWEDHQDVPPVEISDIIEKAKKNNWWKGKFFKTSFFFVDFYFHS